VLSEQRRRCEPDREPKAVNADPAAPTTLLSNRLLRPYRPSTNGPFGTGSVRPEGTA